MDEETIERACYNAMRRREQEISDANGKQTKFFREQEELGEKQQTEYILSQAEMWWLKQQEKKKPTPINPKPLPGPPNTHDPFNEKRKFLWWLGRK